MRREVLVGGYAIGVGLAMLGMWIWLSLAGEIPELATEPLEIGYHLAAEGLTAVALLVAGIGLLRGRALARRALPVALGMLLYTVINSAGYYAQLGEWPMVGMFSVLTVTTGALVVAVLRGWPREPWTTPPTVGEGELHA